MQKPMEAFVTALDDYVNAKISAHALGFPKLAEQALALAKVRTYKQQLFIALSSLLTQVDGEHVRDFHTP